ncbi:hypothetical protein IW262DRAFT_1300560 [Armillaria fumosa]|nr:hypothetical protein IW262DRAFT_1300560 [Armillaria fumosa]
MHINVHFDDNKDEYIDISGISPESPPPQLQLHHRTLVQGPLHHTQSLVYQDLQHFTDNRSIEQRIFGYSLKLRRTITVVGFASSVRHQKEVGKSVPFHEYGGKGTDSLCSHLISHHYDEWIMACDKLKIKISAKNAREVVWAYHEKNPGTSVSEDMLPKDSHNQEFSMETFIDTIMTFVVGDDQSLNVIENHHFCDLILLLRHDFIDKGISHIDNLCTHILESLDKHLEALSKEMKSSEGKISFMTDLWTNQNQ